MALDDDDKLAKAKKLLERSKSRSENITDRSSIEPNTRSNYQEPDSMEYSALALGKSMKEATVGFKQKLESDSLKAQKVSDRIQDLKRQQEEAHAALKNIQKKDLTDAKRKDARDRIERGIEMRKNAILQKEEERRRLEKYASVEAGKKYAMSISSFTKEKQLETSVRVQASRPETLISALAAKEGYGAASLDKESDRLRKERSRLSSSIKAELESISRLPGDRERPEDIKGRQQQSIKKIDEMRKSLEENISLSSTYSKARQLQHREGSDLEGMIGKIARTEKDVNYRQEEARLSDAPEIDVEKEKETLSKLDKAFLEVIETLDNLKKSGTASAEELESVAKKATDLGEQIAGQRNTVDVGEQRRQEKYNTRGAALDMLRNISSFGRDVVVSTPIAKTKAEAARIGIANSRFDIQNAAASGDVMSAILNSGQSKAIEEASSASGKSKGFSALDTALGLATVASLIPLTAGVGNAARGGLLGIKAMRAAGGVSKLFKGVLTAKNVKTAAGVTAAGLGTAQTLNSINVEATEAAVGTYGAEIEKQTQQNYIRAKTGQALMDYSFGAADAVMGMGSRASDQFQQMTTVNERGYLGGRFATTVTAPKDLINFTKMGAAALGSNWSATQQYFPGAPMIGTLTDSYYQNYQNAKRGLFTSGEMTNRASELQKARVISGEQYFQSLGQLNAAGAGNGSAANFEQILANAVERGVNGAKVLSDMTAGVAELSSSFAQRGINVTSGVTSMLTGGLLASQTSMPGASEEMRQSAVKSGIDRLSQLMRGGGSQITVQDLIVNKNLTKLGIKDPFQFAAASELGPQELTSWLTSLNEEESMGQITNKGLGNVFLKNGKIDKDKIKETLKYKTAGISSFTGIKQDRLMQLFEGKSSPSDYTPGELARLEGAGISLSNVSGVLKEGTYTGTKTKLNEPEGDLKTIKETQDAMAGWQNDLIKAGGVLNSATGQFSDSLKTLSGLIIDSTKNLMENQVESRQSLGLSSDDIALFNQAAKDLKDAAVALKR